MIGGRESNIVILKQYIYGWASWSFLMLAEVMEVVKCDGPLRQHSKKAKKHHFPGDKETMY